MIGSGNIDNAMDALNAAVAELQTRIDAGERLTDEDAAALKELTDATQRLRDKAICYYSTFFDQTRVAKAFGLSPARVSQIVNMTYGDHDTVSSSGSEWPVK